MLLELLLSVRNTNFTGKVTIERQEYLQKKKKRKKGQKKAALLSGTQHHFLWAFITC